MCACELSYTCPKCEDTPSDHRYELDEPDDRDAFSEGRSAYDPESLDA